MKSEIYGSPAFSTIHVELDYNEKIMTESGAMASMDSGIDLRSKPNGGILKAFFRKFLGSQSFFINTFSNRYKITQNIILTKSTPGEIICVDVNEGEHLFIQPGSFVACTEKIKLSLSWAGFASFFAREGLFRLRLKGPGKLWYGGFGAITEKEIQGSYIIDSGHLLSYPENMKLNLQLSGGIFSSFFSGEGLVLKLEGNGKIKLQTRSINGLVSWLNPKFWN